MLDRRHPVLRELELLETKFHVARPSELLQAVLSPGSLEFLHPALVQASVLEDLRLALHLLVVHFGDRGLDGPEASVDRLIDMPLISVLICATSASSSSFWLPTPCGG